MRNALSIRAMTVGDLPAVVALWRACQHEGLYISPWDEGAGIRRFLRRNPGLSQVAVRGGQTAQIVGAVLCGHDGRHGGLYHLAIDPAFRRRGLGLRLTRACLRLLAAAGISHAHAWVYKRNKSACRFWKNLGGMMWENSEMYAVPTRPVRARRRRRSAKSSATSSSKRTRS